MKNNKKIGIAGTIVNLIGVIGFAGSMLMENAFASYVMSMLIALGFVIMMCSFHECQAKDSEIAGDGAKLFGAIYACVIFLVYFAQTTIVRNGNLTGQAKQILDYSSFGLFFAYDLMGYGFMSIATFLAGFTIVVRDRKDHWLKWLLHIHGIFALSCFIMPMFPVFTPGMQGGDWIGVAILEFWCLYFLPINLLSLRYFKKNL